MRFKRHYTSIEGKSDKPVYIAILDNKVEIRDASHLWGNGIYRATASIGQELGPEAQVAAIGQASRAGRLVRLESVWQRSEEEFTAWKESPAAGTSAGPSPRQCGMIHKPTLGRRRFRLLANSRFFRERSARSRDAGYPG